MWGKTKDYHEINLIIRWSFFIAFVFIASFCIVFYFLEFEVFYRKALVQNIIVRTILFLITITLVLTFLHKINVLLSNKINLKYLARFDHREELGAYKESRSRFRAYPDTKSIPVLLLHGFSGSPQDFDTLILHLEANHITYYAPLLSGFGLDNTLRLSKVSRNDWKRDVLNAFDLLSSISTNVNIVGYPMGNINIIGYSMGAILADFLCTKRNNINSVILASPAFYTSEYYDPHKKILLNKYSYFVFNLLIPYLPKSLNKEKGHVSDIADPDLAAKNFQYLTAPLSSIRELFLMQDEHSLSGLQNVRDITVFYSNNDKLINIQKLQENLYKLGVAFTTKAFYETGHNLYFDLESNNISLDTISILLDKVNSNLA